MAKKKKSHKKKSQYKARKQSAVVAPQAVAPRDSDSTKQSSPASHPESSSKVETKRPAASRDGDDAVIARRARYEVRHSLLLAGAIMLGLVVLWCVFAYTSLGPQVYKFIRI